MSKNHKQLFKRPEVKKNSPEEIEEVEKVKESIKLEDYYSYLKLNDDETIPTTLEQGPYMRWHEDVFPPRYIIEEASEDPVRDGVMIPFS